MTDFSAAFSMWNYMILLDFALNLFVVFEQNLASFKIKSFIVINNLLQSLEEAFNL